MADIHRNFWGGWPEMPWRKEKRKKMMRILIDIDSVLADIMEVWLPRYNHDYNDDLEKEEITDWEMTKFVKPECGKKIYSYLLQDELYDDMPMVDGALEGVRALERWGHEVFYVTAGFNLGKFRWMKRNGFLGDGYLADRKYIVCYHKNMISGDLIIDDNVDTVKNYPNGGIIFDQPWNRGNYMLRAVGWDEVLRLVENLE